MDMVDSDFERENRQQPQQEPDEQEPDEHDLMDEGNFLEPEEDPDHPLDSPITPEDLAAPPNRPCAESRLTVRQSE